VPETVEVLVRGKVLTGWQSVSVTRAIDAASGSFEITSPARSPYPLAPGDDVQVLASGDLLLSGHIEEVVRTLGSSSSSVRFSGRDNTADLVDCTARNNPGSWVNVSTVQLLKDLASPFGVAVHWGAGALVAAFDTFALRPGDTAWAAIERACRLRGVLVYSDGTGRLVVRDPGLLHADVELVEGENLASGAFTAGDADRFRTYTVLGQRPGSDSSSADLVALVQGEATDQSARAGRTLVIIAEAALSNQTAKERAQWEATVRAARAVRLEATVQGWRQHFEAGPGRLWDINELVAVRAPSIDLDGDLLLQSVTFTQNEREETTSLELVRADAYQKQPDLKAEDDLLREWLDNTTAGEAEPDDIEDPDQ
jgi:prophage tail gpP-like protein